MNAGLAIRTAPDRTSLRRQDTVARLVTLPLGSAAWWYALARLDLLTARSALESAERCRMFMGARWRECEADWYADAIVPLQLALTARACARHARRRRP